MFQIILFLLVMCTSSVYANGIGLDVILYWGAFYSVIVFTLGLALEYLCMVIMARANTSALLIRALMCTILMNVISTCVGAIFRIPFSILFVLFLNRLNAPSRYIPIIGILLIYILVNTVVEVWVPISFFPKISLKKIWFWTFIANTLSMSLIALMLVKGYSLRFAQSIFG